ncbi:MAG: TetR/AcrR family transcriptional regulator [Acidimicrobiales bacterium]|jgi:AcrR family transcriptional regulator|nr:TetR/AcrR family transcriptional regulator [Acidimicrobiales bacterium]
MLDIVTASGHDLAVPVTQRPSRSRQGARRRAGGAETRELLMDVAEQLFAEEGVEAVSIRSINAAAGLAPASVHYHFGDKDGLLRAVIARRGATLVDRERALLEGLEGRRRPPRTAEVVRLLADPLVEIITLDPVGGRRWVTMIADLVAANDDRVYQEGYGPGSLQERIEGHVAGLYPARPRPVIAARWRMASTALLQLLAAAAATAPDPTRGLDPDDVGVIVQFVASGLDGVCRTR